MHPTPPPSTGATLADLRGSYRLAFRARGLAVRTVDLYLEALDSPRCRLTLPLRGFFVAASVPSVRVPDVTDERRQMAALGEDPPIGR